MRYFLMRYWLQRGKRHLVTSQLRDLCRRVSGEFERCLRCLVERGGRLKCGWSSVAELNWFLDLPGCLDSFDSVLLRFLPAVSSQYRRRVWECSKRDRRVLWGVWQGDSEPVLGHPWQRRVIAWLIVHITLHRGSKNPCGSRSSGSCVQSVLETCRQAYLPTH